MSVENVDITQLAAYAITQLERARARERAKYARNRDKRLAYARAYWEANKDWINAKRREKR